MKDTRSKVVSVLDAVVGMGFDGHSVAEIAAETELSPQAVRRSIKALQDADWVAPSEQSGKKEILWVPGKKLLSVSFAYKRNCIQKRQLIESEFSQLSGEVLGNER